MRVSSRCDPSQALNAPSGVLGVVELEPLGGFSKWNVTPRAQLTSTAIHNRRFFMGRMIASLPRRLAEILTNLVHSTQRRIILNRVGQAH